MSKWSRVSVRNSLLASWLVVLVLPTVPLRSAGAAPTAGEVAVARRLFNEAAELQEQKRWAAAADKLREAIKIKDTPGLRYHLAFCEDQLGQLVEAQGDYDRAGELIRAGAHAPDVETLLEEARASLARRVPALTVSLSVNAEVSRFSIDERNLVVTLVGEPIPLNPGEHRLRVEARGYQAFERTVELTIGEQETVSVTLTPSEVTGEVGTAPAEVNFQPRDTGWGAREWVLLSEGIFTAGALGFGIYATIQRSQAATDQMDAQLMADRVFGGLTSEQADQRCATPSAADADLCAALSLDDVSLWTNLLIVGYGAAGAGGLAMLITALAWDNGPSESESASVNFVAAPGRGGFWYGINGRF